MKPSFFRVNRLLASAIYMCMWKKLEVARAKIHAFQFEMEAACVQKDAFYVLAALFFYIY